MNVEALLREAMAPVEPSSPEELLDELQLRLVDWADAAQTELESWEMSAMRNPRNWLRPAAALAVTATAGSALVVLRVRQHHGDRVDASANLAELASKTLADVVEETKRIL